MDVKDAIYKDGTAVQAWPCDGLANQKWSIDVPKPPPRPFVITLDDQNHQNTCLDLLGGDTKNGNTIDIWGCSAGSKGQQWLFPDGEFRIKSVVDPKKCIDAGSP